MSKPPYVLITADTHAGGSHAQYREYLDPEYREAFDEWRGGYKNPAQEHYGSKKKRNWDLEIRNGDQNSQGVVGEVVFPNTVPPFYKKSIVTTQPPKPAEYERCLAGIRAHNRWLVDFCAEDPDRRAGIGLILPNDMKEAVKDIEFIAFCQHHAVDAQEQRSVVGAVNDRADGSEGARHGHVEFESLRRLSAPRLADTCVADVNDEPRSTTGEPREMGVHAHDVRRGARLQLERLELRVGVDASQRRETLGGDGHDLPTAEVARDDGAIDRFRSRAVPVASPVDAVQVGEDQPGALIDRPGQPCEDRIDRPGVRDTAGIWLA